MKIIRQYVLILIIVAGFVTVGFAGTSMADQNVSVGPGDVSFADRVSTDRGDIVDLTVKMENISRDTSVDETSSPSLEWNSSIGTTPDDITVTDEHIVTRRMSGDLVAYNKEGDVSWRRSYDAIGYYAHLASSSSTVFVTRNSEIEALDASSGNPKWSWRVSGDYVEGVLLGEQNLYVIESGSTKTAITALDKSTGEKMWTSTIVDSEPPYDISLYHSPEGTVIVNVPDGETRAYTDEGQEQWSRQVGKIYGTNSDGRLIATPADEGGLSQSNVVGIDAASGEVLWNNSADTFGMYEIAHVSQKSVYINGGLERGDSSFIRVNTRNGQVLWSKTLDGAPDTLWSIDTTSDSVFAEDGRTVVRINKSSGQLDWTKPVWNVEFGKDIEYTNGKVVYIGESSINVLDPETGSISWRHEMSANFDQNTLRDWTISDGGIVYAASGYIGFRELQQGHLEWDQMTGGWALDPPVVNGANVFTLSYNGFLTAFSKETGQMQWRLEPPAQSVPYTRAPEYHDGKITYLTVNSSESVMTAVDTDGTVRWNTTLAEATSTFSGDYGVDVQTIDSGKIFTEIATGYNGALFALNESNGNIVWERRTNISGFSDDDPAITSQTVSVANIGEEDTLWITGYDKEDGTTLWKNRVNDGRMYDARAFANGSSVFVWYDSSNGQGVIAINDSSGEFRWNETFDSEAFASQYDPAMGSEKMYFLSPGASEYRVTAIDRETGSVRWNVSLDIESTYTPENKITLTNGSLYVSTGWNLTVLDPQNGEQITREKVPLGIANTITPESVYSVTYDGEIRRFNVDTDSGSSDGEGPVVVGEKAATDPDGDGLYEDINGDGQVDARDVLGLWNHRRNIQPENFDFTGDGSVDARDVLALWNQL